MSRAPVAPGAEFMHFYGGTHRQSPLERATYAEEHTA